MQFTLSKKSTAAAAAIAAAMMVGGTAHAATVSIELDRNASPTSWTTVWNNPDFGGENVTATGVWTFLNITNTNQWNFSLQLDNNSTWLADGEDGDARLVSWGFDTDPTALDFTLTSPSAPAWDDGDGQGVMSVDHCTFGGNNCAGGGGGGPNQNSIAAGDGLLFEFNFTSDEDSVTLDNFKTRYQSAGEDSDSLVLTAVPLPAAGWLLLAGIGGLAAFRRRKSV